MAAPTELERLLLDLIAVGTGAVPHRYEGLCPDDVDGHDQRDPECPACRVLMRAARRTDVTEDLQTLCDYLRAEAASALGDPGWPEDVIEIITRHGGGP